MLLYVKSEKKWYENRYYRCFFNIISCSLFTTFLTSLFWIIYYDLLYRKNSGDYKSNYEKALPLKTNFLVNKYLDKPKTVIS